MKKNSSLIVVAVLLLLTGISIYLFLSKSKVTSVDDADRNFSFKDTAAITKIFLADKDQHTATLLRTDKGWVVNDKYNCRNDAILNLLEAIKMVEVKMPVPKAGRENVIKFMSFNAIKVEVYVGDEKVKQYYVGHETQDGEGSYMLLSDPETGENLKDPYVCFIPGFIGYLQPRYIAYENDWRDRIVMNYIPPQVSQIKVEQTDTPKDSSFTIDLPDANTFVLKDLNGVQQKFEAEKMRQYLVYYQNLSYEVLITGKNKKLQDSLSLNRPFCTISVNLKNNKQDIYKFYRKTYTGGVSNDMSENFEFDPDRFYMSFDGGRQWALAQYYVFGKLCVNTSYFQAETSVKK